MYGENNQAQSGRGEQERSLWQAERKPARCANCDIEFLWPPTVVAGKIFCCTGCAAGGPCSCDYSQYTSVTISDVIHYSAGAEEQQSSSDSQTV